MTHDECVNGCLMVCWIVKSLYDNELGEQLREYVREQIILNDLHTDAGPRLGAQGISGHAYHTLLHETGAKLDAMMDTGAYDEPGNTDNFDLNTCARDMIDEIITKRLEYLHEQRH